MFGAGGGANLQYLRFERFFEIMATAGEHRFFRLEPQVRGIRRVPIRFAGHSIGERFSTVTQRWHASVRSAPEGYRCIKAYLLKGAKHWGAERLETEMRWLPFVAYAPVRRQLMHLTSATNRVRKTGGRALISYECLALKRKAVPVLRE